MASVHVYALTSTDMSVVVESVEVFYEGAFGADPEGYWFEDLNCIGSEKNILDCPQTPRTCNGKHVAIRCSNESGLNHINSLKDFIALVEHL